MKAIELIVRAALPKEMRDREIKLDAKGVESLLVEVARDHPDKFSDVVKRINDAGRLAAYTMGETLSLDDMKPVVDTPKIFAAMDREIAAAKKAAKSPEEFAQKREQIWLRYSDELEPLTMQESMKRQTGLAFSVASGARGKPAQLKAMITTPGLYQDSVGRTVPLFIRHSFAQGLRPYEHLAGSYGARHSVVSTKRCLWERTQVRMADGRVKEIRDIEVGEKVMGADKNGATFPVTVLNNFDQGHKPVVFFSFRKRGMDPLNTTRLTVYCTRDHKFLREGGRDSANEVVALRDVAKRDYLMCADGKPVSLADERIGPASRCCDLEVDHPDHLFVLANGIIVSNSTAKGGDLGKQWAQTSSHLVVSEDDCGVTDGLDAEVGSGLRNRVLAKATAGLEAGTILDRDAISVLERKKVGSVLVRSPLVCRAKHGICAHCAGADARGFLPPIGEMVGITSAHAAAEPVTQAALSTKHCLKKGTRVRMADFSVKPIEDVKPGDLVLGADVAGRTFPVEVLASWDQGTQDVYKYTFQKGCSRNLRTVECTTEHQILSLQSGSQKKVKAGDLRVSKDHAVLPGPHNGSHATHEPLALLLGVFLGDGNRWNSTTTRHATARNSGTAHITISCADETQIHDMNALLVTHNLVLKKSKRSHDWRIVQIKPEYVKDAKGRVVAGGMANKAKLAALRWGLANKYAHEKRIPSEVLTSWDDFSVGAVLAGYLATDGCVYISGKCPAISFASTSLQLLKDTRDLIEFRAGIVCQSIRLHGSAGEENRKNDIFTFGLAGIDNVARFAAYVGKIPGVKNALLQRLAKAGQPEKNSTAALRAVEHIGPAHCFDITVKHKDQLFVLENGLIVKNTAGQAKGRKKYTGFEYLNQLVQAPEVFKDRAAVAEESGRVTRIEPAPQGGTYVHVNGNPVYVLPGQEIAVKEGDEVEPGDALSDGLVDPRDIVRLRGLGEGRRYLAERLKQMLDDGGAKTDLRHTEMLARAALDHVVVDQQDEEQGVDELPDEVVYYSKLAQKYVPPKDARRLKIKSPAENAVGKFLAAPAMHYTIGTKLTPRMLSTLKNADIDEVQIQDNPPPFSPDMVRLRTATHATDDWMVRFNSSYLSKGLEESATSGLDTNVEENEHWMPRLAYGEGFGQKVKETGKF